MQTWILQRWLYLHCSIGKVSERPRACNSYVTNDNYLFFSPIYLCNASNRSFGSKVSASTASGISPSTSNQSSWSRTSSLASTRSQRRPKKRGMLSSALSMSLGSLNKTKNSQNLHVFHRQSSRVSVHGLVEAEFVHDLYSFGELKLGEGNYATVNVSLIYSDLWWIFWLSMCESICACVCDLKFISLNFRIVLPHEIFMLRDRIKRTGVITCNQISCFT